MKVLDFGISKALAGGATEPEHTLTRTRDGGFLGSPPYMSPEHIRSPGSVDARTDIWSLGVEVPAAVDALVARCLARSRDERFPDVGALAAAIAPFTTPRWIA